VAYLSSRLGFNAYIVLPHDTPEVKKDAVRYYKATIVECSPDLADLQETNRRVSKEKNAEKIYLHDDYKIMDGAATASYEFMEEVKDLDYLLVPIGGGSCSSSSLLSAKYFSPKTQVIGVQPWLARDAFDSLKAKKLTPQYPPYSLAEGVRMSLGQLELEVLVDYMKEIVLVSEEEMIEATRLILSRMKIITELSGALPLAAVIKLKDRFKGKRVGCIITGGNLDPTPIIDNYYSKMHKE
jgi:threonine dehydratase